jgi:hypothetical protein
MSARATSKSVKNGKAPAQRGEGTPQWKCHLDSYPDKRLLRFESKDDLHAAIDLLWTEPFRNLPHDTPDGRTLVVPAEAVEHFVRAGVKFQATKLRSISDLTPAEIERLGR